MTDPALAATFRKPFAEQVAAWRLRLGNLVATSRWDDIWQEGHERAFMAAGVAKADVLADIAAAVDKGITGGTTLAEFRRDWRKIVETHGWPGGAGGGSAKGEAWRTRVIYQTNMRTSYMAGRHAQLVDGKYRFWVYRHSGAAHPRLDHLSWDGVALPPEHPFWKTHYPPNGWGCGCLAEGADSEKGIRRMGGDPDKKLPEGWDRCDPKTGAPPGIGKGWAYAPGAGVAEDIRRMTIEKAARLPAPLGAALSDYIRAMASPSEPLPFQKLTPARSTTAAVARAQAAGVADWIEMPTEMDKVGIETILRTAQEVKERFDLPPLKFIGAYEKHPWGPVPMVPGELAGYFPTTRSVLLRAGTGDNAWVARSLTFDLAEESEQKWRLDLTRAAPEVQERAALIRNWQWSMTQDTDTVMVHEMAHRLHDVNASEIDALLSENTMLREGWHLLVSDYASTDRFEFFAEVFTLYLRGGDGARQRIHPSLLAFLKRLDRLG